MELIILFIIIILLLPERKSRTFTRPEPLTIPPVGRHEDDPFMSLMYGKDNRND